MSAASCASNAVARQVAVVPAAGRELLLPGLRGGELLDVGDDRRLLLVAEPGAAATMRQFSSATSTPASFSVGASTPSSALFARDREQPQLPGLDLALELAEARDADRDLAAEDRRQRLAAAGEGDVVDLGRVDADRLGDQPGGDVVGAAGRAAAPGDRARVGLQRRDEVVHGLDVARRPARRSPATRRSAARSG